MGRQSIKEELKDNTSVDVLGGLKKGLTAKQKRFAEGIANGEKGSEAYRKAYKTQATPKTIANNAYNLKNRGDIKATIQAIERANEVMKYQTAEGLRSLAVSTLVDVLTSPDTSPATRIQTARIIGTMTEVSLFTHRTESKVIHSSEDIKAKILKEINSLMSGSVEDVVARDASSLLNELECRPEENFAEEGAHPSPAPTCDETESLELQHTIPHERSENSHERSENIMDDPLGLKNTSLEKNI